MPSGTAAAADQTEDASSPDSLSHNKRDGSNGTADSSQEHQIERGTGVWYYQQDAHDLYHGTRCQVFVAILIFTNFGVGCTQRQVDPHASTGTGNYNAVWKNIDILFTSFFTVELIFNMYGSWCYKFWVSGWNIFDTIIVSISIMVIFWQDMPGELQIIKLMRAFRVFRLFNRVPSMKKILTSIGKAVPGMVSAFGINILMMCIYSVLAVDLFKDLYEEDCLGLSEAGRERPGAITARGHCYGDDYYGKFSKSIFTLFQVLTGESWSEACVRPILAFYESNDNILYVFLTVLFFVSFIVINALVLLNVVVALLMDGMAADDEDEEDIDKKKPPAQESKEALQKEVTNLKAQLVEQNQKLVEQGQQFETIIAALEDFRRRKQSSDTVL
jgi:hypothetical protein